MDKKDEMSNEVSTAIMAGLQLAIFEVIWGSHDWVERIFIRVNEAGVAVYFECRREPPDEQWESCCYLISEMLDAIIMKDRGRDVSWQIGKRPGDEFVEIMSSSIFRKIAEEHAPWRLPE